LSGYELSLALLDPSAGAMLKLATPSAVAMSSASESGDAARARSGATTGASAVSFS
jgi:hypothetical protein